MAIKSQLSSIGGVADVACATIEQPQPVFISGFELHVLLVEPARDEREMYAQHLGNRGMRVTCAATLAQSLDLARKTLPHIVVIEPCWGHSTEAGLAAIRVLHADPVTHTIPIVAVSGHAFAHERQAALVAGCESFFEKPCPPASLSCELERLSWRYRLRRSAERRVAVIAKF